MPAERAGVRLDCAGALAPAKINLALHVTGRRPDGYHDLSSLVAFAAAGDSLSVRPAETDSLVVTGPFAAALARTSEAGDNIVSRALSLARRIAAEAGREIGPLAIELGKHLPIASGIGGGSADAASLLRLIAAEMPGIGGRIRQEALGLGADLPLCFDNRPECVTGIGEIGAPLAAFPEVPVLLVNPGVPVATAAVFARLVRRDNPALPALPARGFTSLADLALYLRTTRNDLEETAAAIAPSIGTVRAALVAAGAAFARMSGSGATVFGLFETAGAARRAARRIAAERPDWWVLPTVLAASGAAVRTNP